MDYKAAADFLALGATTVQFCTLVMKYGYGVIDHIEEGVSHLMQDRGIGSIKELIGRTLPGPITDFMDLSATKAVSDVDKELCLSCGNCARCPYLAITLDDEKHPVTDASKCIGCGICAHLCPYSAIRMVKVGKLKKAEFVSAACKGCGVCASYCPTRAIAMGRFTDEQIADQIRAFGEGRYSGEDWLLLLSSCVSSRNPGRIWEAHEAVSRGL